jgi:hypothetical protein
MTGMVPRDISELSRERAAEFDRLVSSSPPSRLELGQVWSTRAVLEFPDGRRFETDEPRLVVVLDSDLGQGGEHDHIPVAPISPEIEYATDLDLIVPPSAGPVGFSFMAEVWNETPTLVGHLRQFLGTVSGTAADALFQVYKCHVHDQSVPEELGSWVGIPVFSEDDERLAFQEAEIQAVAYLAMAAAAALALATEDVGPVARGVEKRNWRWQLQARPRLGKLSDLVHVQDIAFAAGLSGDAPTYIIEISERNAYFAGELLCDKRRPYTVYVFVHRVSPVFIGHQCIMELESSEKTWSSSITTLRADTQIKIAEDPDFRPELVEAVRLQVE